MVGHAKSDTKKAQIVWNVMDALYTRAVAAHLHEKGKGPGKAKAGLQKICKLRLNTLQRLEKLSNCHPLPFANLPMEGCQRVNPMH